MAADSDLGGEGGNGGKTAGLPVAGSGLGGHGARESAPAGPSTGGGNGDYFIFRTDGNVEIAAGGGGGGGSPAGTTFGRRSGSNGGGGCVVIAYDLDAQPGATNINGGQRRIGITIQNRGGRGY